MRQIETDYIKREKDPKRVLRNTVKRRKKVIGVIPVSASTKNRIILSLIGISR